MFLWDNISRADIALTVATWSRNLRADKGAYSYMRSGISMPSSPSPISVSEPRSDVETKLHQNLPKVLAAKVFTFCLIYFAVHQLGGSRAVYYGARTSSKENVVNISAPSQSTLLAAAKRLAEANFEFSSPLLLGCGRWSVDPEDVGPRLSKFKDVKATYTFHSKYEEPVVHNLKSPEDLLTVDYFGGHHSDGQGLSDIALAASKLPPPPGRRRFRRRKIRGA